MIVKEVEHESQVEYTVQNFKNSNGQLDYTKAPGYDESIVRSNINKVRHSSQCDIVAPTPIKEVVVEPPTDYFIENRQCGKTVNRINSACD